jgi:hypothetical protein
MTRKTIRGTIIPFHKGNGKYLLKERGPVTDIVWVPEQDEWKYKSTDLFSANTIRDIANYFATNDGYDLVEDVDTGAYSYRKKLPAGRKYIALSNGTYVDVAEDQKINPQASLFTSKYGQSIARDLTTHGTMSANDSTFVSGLKIGPVGFPAKGSKGEAIYDENGEDYVQGAILTGSDGNDYYMSRSREDQGNGTTKSKLRLQKVVYADKDKTRLSSPSGVMIQDGTLVTDPEARAKSLTETLAENNGNFYGWGNNTPTWDEVYSNTVNFKSKAKGGPLQVRARSTPETIRDFNGNRLYRLGTLRDDRYEYYI